MNEELQAALTEILNKTIEATGKASEFLVEEIPDVIQQLLAWHFVYNLTIFLVSIVSALIFIYACYRSYKYIQKKEDNMLYPFLLFYSIPLIIIPQGLNLVWLKIWVAPKIFLIEYAAKLVK